VGRRDRPRMGAVCPLVRLVSGVRDHSIGDRPRPDPVWETARFGSLVISGVHNYLIFGTVHEAAKVVDS